MKHEITTELRNSVIQVITNSIIRATWIEVSQLLEKLKMLPEIPEPPQSPELSKPKKK